MPMNAGLSQAFYDRLGHEVADEMVSWFNQMDAANRSDARELHELSLARFDAKLAQRFSESSRLFERELGKFALELKELRIELKDQQLLQMRWIIGMWLAVLVAVIGLWIRR